VSSDTPDWNAPGHGGSTQRSAGTQQSAGTGQGAGTQQSAGTGQSAYPGEAQAEPTQWRGQRTPVSPVDETATRVTGRRAIQYIIDYILAGIIPGLAYWLLDRGSGFLNGLGWLLATVIALAAYYLYWVERPRSHGGQTFGMQLFGLRVISNNGTLASRAQLFVRGILLIVDTLFFGLVGFITMICSRYRQRVGDHVAGTLVVRAHYRVAP
jgi:uncharacterized RDD family membrane protein YckC